MNILLLGKDGQVGRELQRSLLPLGPVAALGRAQADLSRPQGLKAVLDHHRPQVIVSPAAYTAVDAAESDPATAHSVNADAPAVLAQWAAQHGALLVHYSTDYVFDGTKAQAYTEDDAPAPLNVYGASKQAGEQAIMDAGGDALIFRTSWVVSAHGHNFIRTIWRLARERPQLSIVDDQMGAPTSAELLADTTALAILGWHHQRLAGGLYHLTASGDTSWHGLAHYVVAAMAAHGIPTALTPDAIAPIPTTDYPTPAARPKNSRLDTHKIPQALGIELPDWRIHVDRALAQLARATSPQDSQ